MTKAEALEAEKRNTWHRFRAFLVMDFIRAMVIGTGLLIPFGLAVILLRLFLR